jgi:hypothetical protein
MIVVHFAKVSVLYPRVVILSLHGWLETSFLPFFTLPLVYGLEITTCHYKGLLPELVMLFYGFPEHRVVTCSAKVSSWLEPLLHLVDQIMFCVFPHTTEQDSEPTTSIISKQAIPYRTRGGTYCPGVSTPKTRSLADSRMTNHNNWQIHTVSTILTHAQTIASNLTTVTLHHNGWKTNTLNTQHKPKLNIIKMEDLYETEDCMAKQFYPSIKTKI